MKAWGRGWIPVRFVHRGVSGILWLRAIYVPKLKRDLISTDSLQKSGMHLDLEAGDRGDNVVLRLHKDGPEIARSVREGNLKAFHFYSPSEPLSLEPSSSNTHVELSREAESL
jgi:hypothetical protein